MQGWIVLIGGGEFSFGDTEEVDRFLVTKMPDKDTMEMTMWVGGGKDPAFSVIYKRKKK